MYVAISIFLYRNMINLYMHAETWYIHTNYIETCYYHTCYFERYCARLLYILY